MSFCFAAAIKIRSRAALAEPDDWRLIEGLEMPEKYRGWDVVNYLDSVQDACGYLQSCLEEAPEDTDFRRLALNDVARARG